MKKEINFLNIYSYSKIGLFFKCPKQYHFSYLDPEIAPIKNQFKKQRDFQTKGRAVHDAITLFYHLSKKKRNFENLKKCLKESWYSDLVPSRKPPLGELGGFQSLSHEKSAYLESLRLLKNFLELADINLSLYYLPGRKIKNSFSDYEKLIKPLNNIFFISGKFDLINRLEDGTLEVIDYKTGKGNSDSFQLKFYKLLAELNFKKKVSRATFYYLYGKKIKSFKLQDTDKNKIRAQVLEKIQKIESAKKFSPKVSKLCFFCDFQEICPHTSLRGTAPSLMRY